eukprot:m.211668 g.211668  ORF g.211668 m.211668 type:complete len:484 (+) comp15842_c0_seq3:2589-4040(+)
MILVSQDLEGVVKWYKAMLNIGCVPTDVTFTSAIKSFGAKKNIQAAETWFEAMRLVGIQPTEKVYSSIINVFARARDVQGAERWFKCMQEANLEPDHVTYNIMINVHASVRDVQGAERWYMMLRQGGPLQSLTSCSSMATAYSNARTVPFQRVKILVQDIRKSNLKPDYELLAVLLKCCARANPTQVEFATMWFQEFIGGTFLSPGIETTALPLAVGAENSRHLCAWAREAYPSCNHNTKAGGASSSKPNAATTISSSAPVNDGDSLQPTQAQHQHQPEPISMPWYTGGGNMASQEQQQQPKQQVRLPMSQSGFMPQGGAMVNVSGAYHSAHYGNPPVSAGEPFSNPNHGHASPWSQPYPRNQPNVQQQQPYIEQQPPAWLQTIPDNSQQEHIQETGHQEQPLHNLQNENSNMAYLFHQPSALADLWTGTENQAQTDTNVRSDSQQQQPQDHLDVPSVAWSPSASNTPWSTPTSSQPHSQTDW